MYFYLYFVLQSTEKSRKSRIRALQGVFREFEAPDFSGNSGRRDGPMKKNRPMPHGKIRK